MVESSYMYCLAKFILLLTCNFNTYESRRCMLSPTVPADDNVQRIKSSSFRSDVLRRNSIRPSAAPIIPSKNLLLYGGGDPIDHIGAIVNPKVILVFWSSQWSTSAGDPNESANLMNNFFMN